jgi:precorrin-6B methylase 1
MYLSIPVLIRAVLPIWQICLKVAEMTVIPAASSFSLACACLSWPLANVKTFSLTNRPIASIALALYPGAPLLMLTADRRHTPARKGFSPVPNQSQKKT